MKLIKFRIQHYKSITDSGWCWLASDVTTLAGKNESGKSAILEALRDFQNEVQSIPDGAIPIDDSGEPMLEMCFEVEKSILDEIAEETGITLADETRKYVSKNGVTIIKHHDGRYDLDEQIGSLLNEARNEANATRKNQIQHIIGYLSNIDHFSTFETPELEGDIATIQDNVRLYLQGAQPHAASMPDEDARGRVDAALNTLKTENDVLDNEDAASKFADALIIRTPYFIFFSDFSHMLPYEIPFEEAKNHKTVQDFAKLAGLDLDEVVNATDSQRRRNMLSRYSAKVSGDFKGHWKQDELDLVAEADGDNLRLGVRESGGTSLFKAEQRSKGFQWFLSFYLRLNAEQAETKVILIDEPGLYLHSKAQKDVLKVFEILSDESQVIISTHSPYLIDAQRLDRVRLILKDDQTGTRIENKIHKDADSETLTPIMTAIGLDISSGFSMAGKKNVLFEGISDYYFMQGLREHTKGNKANFIPCVGAQKIPQLVSLLIGWDLEFLAVLDNDSEGKRIAKELSEKLSIEQDRIIFISEKNGFAVEDLFTHEDFNNYVLEEPIHEDAATSNSIFLKENRLDKVLLAKTFFEKMKDDKSNIKLSKETIEAFKEVFDKINTGFKVS